MLRIITDFDGPIMDVSERYYHVYQLCLQKIQQSEQEIQAMSKSEFWQLKRAKVPERKIGLLSGLNEQQAEQFAQLRRETVHQLAYLQYDRMIPGAEASLEKIQNLGIDLAVMTMRRVKELDLALNNYNLGRFFPLDRRYCLSNDYVKTADVKDKPLLMEKALKELPPAADVWMVGDTEADIVAAKTHGLKVIGVLSGIRDRHSLESYQPDSIVNNLDEAVDLIASSFATANVNSCY